MPSSVRVVFNHCHLVAELLHAEAKRIVAETAQEVVNDAQDHAAVDTGFMRNSGYIVTTETSGYAVAAASAASADATATMLPEEPAPPKDTTAYAVFGAEHAVYVEMGTVKMGAQPFLAPAAARKRTDWQRRWTALAQRLNTRSGGLL